MIARIRIVAWALVLGFLVAAPLAAQEAQPGERRAQVEQRARQQFARILKERLELTDDQLRRLGETSRKYEERRRALNQQERTARFALRSELEKGDDKADQARVGRLLDSLIAVQRERLTIVEHEQRDLAAFLTPVQRAKYAAMQEHLRRRVEDMRRRRDGRPGGGRPFAPRGP